MISHFLFSYLLWTLSIMHLITSRQFLISSHRIGNPQKHFAWSRPNSQRVSHLFLQWVFSLINSHFCFLSPFLHHFFSLFFCNQLSFFLFFWTLHVNTAIFLPHLHYYFWCSHIMKASPAEFLAVYVTLIVPILLDALTVTEWPIWFLLRPCLLLTILKIV